MIFRAKSVGACVGIYARPAPILQTGGTETEIETKKYIYKSNIYIYFRSSAPPSG